MKRTSRLREAWRPHVALLIFGLSACAGAGKALQSNDIVAGAHYVAMGSSYASGPGVGELDTNAPIRCGRSQDNYAQQLARKRALDITDVSCSGATTAHILAPLEELPAQIDAIDAQTRLVTVTIGGNDLDYMGSLFKAYCRAKPELADPECNPPSPPSDEAYGQVADGLRTIAEEVRRRAPEARLIFVDYLTVLPTKSTCAITPLNDQDANNSRNIARRLTEITAQVALETGNEVLTASLMSSEHHACSDDPWMTGWPNPGKFVPQAGVPKVVPYHPNLSGMTAIADALDERLSQ